MGMPCTAKLPGIPKRTTVQKGAQSGVLPAEPLPQVGCYCTAIATILLKEWTLRQRTEVRFSSDREQLESSSSEVCLPRT